MRWQEKNAYEQISNFDDGAKNHSHLPATFRYGRWRPTLKLPRRRCHSGTTKTRISVYVYVCARNRLSGRVWIPSFFYPRHVCALGNMQRISAAWACLVNARMHARSRRLPTLASNPRSDACSRAEYIRTSRKWLASKSRTWHSSCVNERAARSLRRGFITRSGATFVFPSVSLFVFSLLSLCSNHSVSCFRNTMGLHTSLSSLERNPAHDARVPFMKKTSWR